jgi:hypothetical protein
MYMYFMHMLRSKGVVSGINGQSRKSTRCNPPARELGMGITSRRNKISSDYGLLRMTLELDTFLGTN